MKHTLHAALGAAPLLAILVAESAEAVELEFTPPPPTLNGSATAFSAELLDADGEAQIRWDFGDGTSTEFSPTETSVEHTYAAPGHYSVNVVAQDDGGFASFSYLHAVYTQPTAAQPQSSTPLLFDGARQLFIAANEDNGTVTLVDSATFEKVAEIEVFQQPVALAFAPDGMLWVLHKEDYAVAIVDVDQERAVDFFRLPYASQPAGLVFSPSGQAYVTLTALGQVAQIDPTSHELVTQREVAPMLRGITISGDGADLWVTRFISPDEQGEVYRLDATTLDTITRYDLVEDTTTEDTDAQGRGLPNYIFSVSVTPDGTQAWVPSKKDNMSRGLMRDGLAITQDNAVRPLISILDLALGEELFDQRIDLDDRNLPRSVMFTPLGDWAFVSVFGSNMVELRDGFDRSFVTALRGDLLMGPVATVMDGDNHLAVLADLSRTLVVYDVSDLLTGVDQSTRMVAEVPLVADEKMSSEVLRGQQVFANAEDKRMASEGYLSCSSCHFEGFEDGRVWDFFDRGEGFRNTTSMLGRRGTGHGLIHWSGNFNEIQDFDGPIRVHQGGLGFIPLDVYEMGTVADPFGDPKAGLDADLDAMAAYAASLASIPRSPFRNSDGTLTEQGEAGQAIFLDLGCDSCHSGEDFTNSAEGGLHDVGTLTELSGGRLGGELTGIDTPTLLGIWQTAPYLHDGSAPTLMDVLTTRNPSGQHGDTSLLTAEELDDLVAYLQQIDQGLPANELTLPSVEDAMGGAGGDGNDGDDGTGGSSNPSDGGAQATGGVPSDSATGGTDVGAPVDDSASTSGCSCKLSPQRDSPETPWWSLAALGLVLARRTRRRRS